MSVQRWETFFALLALAALVGAAFVAIAGRRRGLSVLADLSAARYRLAAVVAATSMVGSLYFSESVGYVPCTLCWYQRIAMYATAAILVVASFRRDGPRPYVIVLAGIGAAIATYHWLLERWPSIDAGVCTAEVPCEFVWFERFGFVTLPFMALCGFLAILALITLPETR